MKTSEVELYKAVGWFEEPLTYVYSKDGRSLSILKREVEAYKNVGWYDNIDQISKIMVSPDGIETRVFSDYYIQFKLLMLKSTYKIDYI